MAPRSWNTTSGAANHTAIMSGSSSAIITSTASTAAMAAAGVAPDPPPLNIVAMPTPLTTPTTSPTTSETPREMAPTAASVPKRSRNPAKRCANSSSPPSSMVRQPITSPALSTGHRMAVASGPSSGMKPITNSSTNSVITIAIHMPAARLNKLQPSAIQSQPRPAATVRPPGMNLPCTAAAGSETLAVGAEYGLVVISCSPLGVPSCARARCRWPSPPASRPRSSPPLPRTSDCESPSARAPRRSAWRRCRRR